MSSPHPDELAPARALVEAWRADRPSPAELQRGYRRFTERRSKDRQRRAHRLPYWVLAGVLLGVSLAQAATSKPWRWLGVGQAPSTPAAPHQTEHEPARKRGVRAAPPSMPPVVSEPAPAAIAISPPPLKASTNPATSGSALPAQEQWQRAARALRDDDFRSAQRALLEIEQNAAAGERDAAKLARAQLLSSHGDVEEATQLLQQLREHAQSELVRQKARDLLARPTTKTAPGRSSYPAPDINQP